MKSIEADRERIRALNGLASFRLRRDKFHGHFDKKYFFERKKIDEDAPLQRNDLHEAQAAIGQIINSYSADFDGSRHSWGAVNIGDLDTLLSHARRKTPRRGG